MAEQRKLIDFEKARKSVMEILAGKVTTPIAVKVAMAMQEQSVDAVEVVHGQWRRFINGDGEYKYLCGVCEKMVTYEMGGSNYCPNCGAKMDGGNEDG